ncbi:MAG: hypothetical protein AABW89_04035 [Nanoarchaeota archaeon]
MKFNFRKIASTLASTAILGSTVAFAAAANFPAPFVQNGAADVAIVYGNSLDLVAVTDISTSLSSALASSGSGSPATSEAYPLFTSSTPIQLNNSISSVRSSITSSNLPAVLGDEDFSGNVDATATFSIVPGTNRVTFAKQPTSSDDPINAVTMSSAASSYLYNSTINFNKVVNFTHADSKGEDITLFGQKFLVGSATDTTTLVLFKSAEKLYLSVGGTTSTPSQTVTVGEETYTVELTAATDTSATIKVTDSSGGSEQKEVNEAASKKIRGLEVSVNNADESTATNVIQAEVVVGASRIKLQDASEVLVGSDDDPIQGTRVSFQSGSTPTTYPGNITKVTVQVFAEDGSSDALAEGDSFEDPVFGSFRFVYEPSSLTEEQWDEIVVKPSGNDHIAFSATNWQGKSVTSQEWVNNESGGTLGPFLGDSNEYRIYVREMATINESAYTVVGNEDDGLLVKLRTLTNSSGGGNTYSSDKVTFENVFDSTETFDAVINGEGTGSIDIAGKTYTVTYYENASDSGNGAGRVLLQYPDSSTATQMVLFPSIETKNGAKMMFVEPLTLNLSSNTGQTGVAYTDTNLTGILIPDGDGFTTTAIADPGDPAGGNWTFGGTAINTSSNNSMTFAVGTLTFNVSASSVRNQVSLNLMDPSSGGTRITSPAMVLFEERDESSNYQAIVLTSGGAGISTSGAQITDSDFTWNTDTDMGNPGSAWGAVGLQSESNDDLYYMEDQWGTKIETDESNTNAYSVTVIYPDEQVTANIYVDSLATTGSTTLGDVKVMDDELASSGMSGKNLIVVGGSCVNTAASTLLGGSAGCGASWTAATGAGSGEWIIQSFANPWASSKIATLVAGWEQGDTANAATYLKTQNPKTDVGHKLTGTTATAATVVTA